jgi:lipoprotein-releasing system permease protein
MRFSWFLAFRYLKPRGTAFSVITLLSIIGVLLGVATLIVVIGVMSGFDRQIRDGFLKLDPHIFLRDTDGMYGPKATPEEAVKMGFKTWRETLPIVRQQPGITQAYPYITLMTLVEADTEGTPQPEVANFIGIDMDNKAQLERVKGMMVAADQGGGEFDLSGDNVLVNIRLAMRLGLAPGQKLITFSPENLKQIRTTWDKREKSKDNEEERKSLEEQMDTLLTPTEFIVAGLINSDQHQDVIVFSLDNGQMLSGKASEDYVTGLAVETEAAFRAEHFARQMMQRRAMPQNWGAETWIDRHRGIFNAVQNERSMMYVVLMIIVIVAAFSTSISMIIFTMQKRREIGMIRALGAKTGQVLSIFGAQGMVVGIVGVGLGVVAGGLVLKYRNGIRAWLAEHVGINIFASDIYQLPEIPAYLRPSDWFWICAPAFLLCGVAAVVPAIWSCRKDPARDLRGDR